MLIEEGRVRDQGARRFAEVPFACPGDQVGNQTLAVGPAGIIVLMKMNKNIVRGTVRGRCR